MDAKKVFVIHGRNESARSAMFHFLRSIGLNPLEWSQLIAATGKGSPYVGEVLEKGFSIAQAAVALMTPDDLAKLHKPLQRESEPPHETELTPQPRQNVLFEAGMAMGRFPDRTIIVELGRLRPMSDTTGRHVIRMNNSFANRQELANRLRTAGCDVDLHGTDWHSSGDFLGCITSTTEDINDGVDGKFSEYLEGLSGDELYLLAGAVNRDSQTLNECGPNDVTPQVLVSKGFLEPVPMSFTLEGFKRTRAIYNISNHVWSYLRSHKSWLFEQALRKNTERADRLPNLRQWLQNHQQNLAEPSADIQTILAEYRLIPSKLLERYPFGWILFNHNPNGTYFPFPADELHCKADWLETRLALDVDNKMFFLVLPELCWEREPQTLNFIENTHGPYTGQYHVGKPVVVQTKLWVEGEPQIHLEVLDDTQRSPVYVIGFKKPPLGSGPPSSSGKP